jgi:hypothetical protein
MDKIKLMNQGLACRGKNMGLFCVGLDVIMFAQRKRISNRSGTGEPKQIKRSPERGGMGGVQGKVRIRSNDYQDGVDLVSATSTCALCSASASILGFKHDVAFGRGSDCHFSPHTWCQLCCWLIYNNIPY